MSRYSVCHCEVKGDTAIIKKLGRMCVLASYQRKITGESAFVSELPVRPADAGLIEKAR